jgi:beta-N-acetylhexosaminidase
VHEAAARAGSLPPLVAIDEEGGRVTRLPAPFRPLPPMRRLGALGDPELVRRAGHAVGRALAALGINLDFAPILDVDSNPANPIIGDRAFSSDPVEAARLGLAFARGLADGGVLGCGKHFPGHGDTDLDSHVALPILRHGRARLDAVELAPFARAAEAGLESLMSAHVVVDALDAGVPATLSRRIVTDLLRGELGYDGVLFSDDLEMRAVADRYTPAESGVLAIEAGCDALLVCREVDAALATRRALAERCEADAGFAARLDEACARVTRLRELARERRLRAEAGGPSMDEVHAELAARGIEPRS